MIFQIPRNGLLRHSIHFGRTVALLVIPVGGMLIFRISQNVADDIPDNSTLAVEAFQRSW